MKELNQLREKGGDGTEVASTTLINTAEWSIKMQTKNQLKIHLIPDIIQCHQYQVAEFCAAIIKLINDPKVLSIANIGLTSGILGVWSLTLNTGCLSTLYQFHGCRGSLGHT